MELWNTLPQYNKRPVMQHANRPFPQPVHADLGDSIIDSISLKAFKTVIDGFGAIWGIDTCAGIQW